MGIVHRIPQTYYVRARLVAVLVGSALSLGSCFELFETVSVDSGWRMKYALHIQSDMDAVINHFGRALGDLGLIPIRGRSGELFKLTYDSPWSDFGRSNFAAFQVTAEPGIGGKNHVMRLTRSWGPTYLGKYASPAVIRMIVAQARQPGWYKFTLQMPGRIQSAKMVKNGVQQFAPKRIHEGHAYWLIPDGQLGSTEKMEVVVQFDGNMTVPQVLSPSAGPVHDTPSTPTSFKKDLPSSSGSTVKSVEHSSTKHPITPTLPNGFAHYFSLSFLHAGYGVALPVGTGLIGGQLNAEIGGRRWRFGIGLSDLAMSWHRRAQLPVVDRDRSEQSVGSLFPVHIAYDFYRRSRTSGSPKFRASIIFLGSFYSSGEYLVKVDRGRIYYDGDHWKVAGAGSGTYSDEEAKRIHEQKEIPGGTNTFRTGAMIEWIAQSQSSGWNVGGGMEVSAAYLVDNRWLGLATLFARLGWWRGLG